jgi:hypothetical protein
VATQFPDEEADEILRDVAAEGYINVRMGWELISLPPCAKVSELSPER